MKIGPEQQAVEFHQRALQRATQGDLAGAKQYLVQALGLNRSVAVYWSDLASVLGMQQDFQGALTALQHALSLSTPHAHNYYNLGLTLRHLGRMAEALEAYRRGLLLDCKEALLYKECINLCIQMHAWNGVLEFGQDAERYRVADQIEYLPGHMFLARRYLLDWHDDESGFARIEQGVQQGKPVVQPGVGMLAMPLTSLQQLRVTVLYQQRLIRTPARIARAVRPGPLRIAYLSSDFRSHPVLHLTRGLFRHHDPAVCTVFVISLKTYAGDVEQRRFAEEVSFYQDISEMNDAEAMSFLRSLDLDVAIDLNGISGDARTELFAQRIAPVQVNYLGYPGTMGTACHDYILADRVVLPATDFAAFSEKVVWLPGGCFQVNDRQGYAYIERIKPLNSAEKLILASFNSLYKVTPVVFRAWMTILRRQPQTELWLVVQDQQAQQRLLQLWTAAELAAERLVFCHGLDYEAHLQRLSGVDLILDTLPFGGGTSTTDALMMGVPVLTCRGQTFAGRMSASLLQHAGLDELVTEDMHDYIERACCLLERPDRLADLRCRISSDVVQNRLFHSERQTRMLECALIRMVERYRQGLQPEPIDLSSETFKSCGDSLI